MHAPRVHAQEVYAACDHVPGFGVPGVDAPGVHAPGVQGWSVGRCPSRGGSFLEEGPIESGLLSMKMSSSGKWVLFSTKLGLSYSRKCVFFAAGKLLALS